VTATLKEALCAIPEGLRAPLIQQFEEMLFEYRAGRWETVGLKAGKISEIVYTILAGYVRGSYPAVPSKPKNMVDACQALEQANANRSVRIQIPRLLIAIYELRNNRAIGHIGGDVDPNHMDAELFLRAAKWLIAELVRVFARLDANQASDLIERITERSLPVVWEGAGVKRILKPSLSARDKALALAYSSPNGVSSEALASWSGYGNLSRFRSSVLLGLHKEAFIHFNKLTDVVTILLPGVRYVEASGILVLG
jgi:hypothetical protein